MNTKQESSEQQPARRYRSFEEFCDTFYRSAQSLRRQVAEEQTASFGRRLAKQIVRGESQNKPCL